MTSWLECLTPDRVVHVLVLAADIVLCSWARHFTQDYGASLHPGVKVGTGKNAGGSPVMD